MRTTRIQRERGRLFGPSLTATIALALPASAPSAVLEEAPLRTDVAAFNTTDHTVALEGLQLQTLDGTVPVVGLNATARRAEHAPFPGLEVHGWKPFSSYSRSS